MITGCLGGIGKEITKLLVRVNNVKLYLHSRSKSLHSVRQFYRNITNYKVNIDKKTVGFDMDQVSNLSTFLELDFHNNKNNNKLDCIIHNAGVMSQSVGTSDTYAVNCISPSILTLLLLPELFNSKNPQVVFITSSSHIRSKTYESGDVFNYLKTSSSSHSKGWYSMYNHCYYLFLM